MNVMMELTLEPTSYPEPYLEEIVEKAIFNVPASVIYRQAYQKVIGISVE